MNTTDLNGRDIHRTGRDFVLSRAKDYATLDAQHIVNAMDLLTEQRPVSFWTITAKQSIRRAWGLCRFWDAEAADVIAMLLFDCYHRGMPVSEFRAIFGDEAGDAYYTYIQECCAEGETLADEGDAIGKRYLRFMRDTGTLVALNDNQRRNARVWYSILCTASDKMYRKVRASVCGASAGETCVLDRAYALLKVSCRHEITPSGESCVVHPLRVAAILSELGYDEEVMAAALLCEPIRLGACTLESVGDTCGAVVRGYVAAADRLQELFLNADEYDASTMEGYVVRFKKNARFAEDIRAALGIRAADLLCVMSLSESRPAEWGYDDVGGREFFKDLLREYGLTDILRLFDNDAWRASDRRRYERIRSKYRAMCARNRTHVDDMLSFIRGLLNEDLDRELRSCGTGGYDVRVIERDYLPVEVYDLINPAGEKLCDPEELVSKYNMPLCDIDIVIMPNSPVGTDVLFATRLVHAIEGTSGEGRCVIRGFHKNPAGSLVLALEDAFCNVYRCRIVEWERYRAERVGGALYDDENASRRRILVHVGERALLLPVGATVIDAAFKLSSEVGLSLRSARIGQRLLKVTDALHDGDRLTIEADARCFGRPFVLHAEPDWLSHAITERARDELGDFLSCHL